MKIPLTIAAAVIGTSNVSAFELNRIKYKDLQSFHGDLLLNSLNNDGIVSISNIPGLKELKRKALTKLHSCLMDDQESMLDLEHTYEDGTIRRTKASFTIPGPGGMQSLFKEGTDPESLSLSPVCDGFNRNIRAFREKVHEVTAVFARKLSYELQIDESLMQTEDGSYSFDTVEDVVNEGLHLEHFHSYQNMKPNDTQNLRPSISESVTIDMHTDQGFFIAFTPGMNVPLQPNSHEADLEKPTQVAQDFFIEMSDESVSQVSFTEEDDLVFMIGDGAKQYINPKINDESKMLRATPHTVTIKNHQENLARVWYGRMVLPPQGAYSEKEEMTYAEVRSLLSTKGGNNNNPGIGCSSSLDMARQLEDAECPYNSTLCWHRCMYHADHETWGGEPVSRELCEDRNLQLQCVNIRDQVWDGTHGDYFPACSNTTVEVTPVDDLENFPRDECSCAEEWETFSSKDGYDNEFDLSIEGTTAKFMWSVVDDETIRGRLAFSGLYGWIALGFPSVDGKHAGMNGGHIMMGVPGGDYSPVTGLNMSAQGSVDGYQISYEGSSFRHWDQPLSDGSGANGMVEILDDCHTAMTFETNMINNKTFNVNGTDNLMWAANGQDVFVSYHGANRARFNITWKTGDATVISDPRRTYGPKPEEPDCSEGTSYDDDNAKTDDTTTITGTDENGALSLSPILGAMMTSFVAIMISMI